MDDFVNPDWPAELREWIAERPNEVEARRAARLEAGDSYPGLYMVAIAWEIIRQLITRNLLTIDERRADPYLTRWLRREHIIQ